MPGDTSNSSVRIRRRTAAWFTANNLVLFEAQFGYETDTRRMKLGDGVTPWNDLPYMDVDTSDDGAGGGAAQAPMGLPYTFITTTSASGIKDGEVRINNVLPGSATTMWIAQNDAGLQDRGTVLNTLSAGGLVYINTAGDDGSVGVFRVTAMVDSGTYYTLTVNNFSGALPNEGAEVRVTIAPVEVTGVKRYRAVVAYNGGAPTYVVSVNELGVTPSFLDAFTLVLDSSGAFTAGKTYCPAQNCGFDLNSDQGAALPSKDSTSRITFYAPGLEIAGMPVEIDVYA